MGIGSSLLQFVESLRQDPPREAAQDRQERDRQEQVRQELRDPGPATPAPVSTRPDPLVEVTQAVAESRRRLSALADRLGELRDHLASEPGSSTPAK